MANADNAACNEERDEQANQRRCASHDLLHGHSAGDAVFGIGFGFVEQIRDRFLETAKAAALREPHSFWTLNAAMKREPRILGTAIYSQYGVARYRPATVARALVSAV